MKLEDKEKLIKTYHEEFQKYGYSPKSLLWNKGKQDIRFNILSSFYDFENKSILDIGCGFGDFNKYLQKKIINYLYFGIDLVPDFIRVGKERYNQKNIRFEQGNFLEKDFNEQFDFIIASGIFNLKLDNTDNYSYIESVISKAFKIAKDGLAFDFLSDKVDYQYEYTFHSSPERILSIAYKFSRNVILRNDYMPFEFSLFIFKDDSFKKEDTLFTRYKQINNIKDVI